MHNIFTYLYLHHNELRSPYITNLNNVFSVAQGEKRMNEPEKLEKRIDVLLQHLTTNGKKIKQQRMRNGTLDTRRLDATVRIAKELLMCSELLNEFWENPESGIVAFN